MPEYAPCVVQYFRDILESFPLSKEQEIELVRRLKAGDRWAEEKLIYANLRFVVTVAKQYFGNGLPLADLISSGNLGLVEAARRFDESVGVKFTSYAVWWIRQAILQELAEHGRMVRLPNNKINAIVKLRKAIEAESEKLERAPENYELAEEIGWGIDEVDEILWLTPYEFSLDAPVKEGQERTFLGVLPDFWSNSPDDEMMEKERREIIAKALGALDERERKIIKLYFMFEDGAIGHRTHKRKAGIALEDIGRLLDPPLTRERVRQIRDVALGKLRRIFEKGL